MYNVLMVIDIQSNKSIKGKVLRLFFFFGTYTSTKHQIKIYLSALYMI